MAAPEAGTYRVYIRYASPEAAAEVFRINDRMAGDGRMVNLPASGGWNAFLWRILPQKFDLEKGRNVLKMIAVSGRLRIDKFILVRE